MKNIVLIILSSFLLCSWSPRNPKIIDISGQWTVQLDSADIGLKNGWQNKDFQQKVFLPGTTDDFNIGIPNKLSLGISKPQLSHLTRNYNYLGAAWYTREISIPNNWEGKKMILKLERVIWKTNVWVDGKEIKTEQNSLVSPHYFDLSDYLIPGKKQRITIRVDNRKQFEISHENLAHSYTNETQIIWNGIIGKMNIEALDPINISNVAIIPDVDLNKIKIDVTLNNNLKSKQKGVVNIVAINKKSKKAQPLLSQTIQINSEQSKVSFNYSMDKNVILWSEFSPEMYELNVQLTSGNFKSEKSVDFGMRKFSKSGNGLAINNKPVFLRGTLECNIFPLKGHPPMDKKGWQKVFFTAKKWGLNHLRFHSWCPPEAAFEVADEMGFYLQVELPVWILNIGKDKKETEYLYSEAQHMIDEYGNHPSFCMWSMGNELQGDMALLTEMVKNIKSKDQRHLYTSTSFTFEKGFGALPQSQDDFFITQWTDKGWVRGQGVFNSESPTFNKDYKIALDGFTVPLITHEIGQYAVYPNIDEISKYTGVLKPINFMSIKEDLERKGLINKAADFTKASGKLAVILYKEEIERALKTAGISGFQLLDLHDFPGQGTATVGLLDAFWDSKNLISPEDFRQFCSPVVPLLRFPKATYTSNEIFTASLDMSNFSGQVLNDKEIEWSIQYDNVVLASGSVTKNINSGYNNELFTVKQDLQKIQKATKLTFKVNIKDSEYKNQWNIWVYPENPKINYGQVVYTNNLEEANKYLKEGRNVLLNPDWKKIKGIEGKFVPVFWSPVHFPKQAGTMGVLCDPNHNVFIDFPTDMHTNWQWWDLNVNSTSLIVDSIEGGNSIVQMIDNFANNRKLTTLFEGKVYSGKLVLASFDLTSDLKNRPVAKQMLISILDYMNSSFFNPPIINNPGILSSILLQEDKEKVKEASTSIY